MKNVKYFILLFVLGAIAISCGDDDGTAPILTITSPADNSTFTVADTIPLMGTATDETALGEITITSDLGLSQSITTFDSPTSHSLNYSITLDSTTAAGAYNLTVTAADADGNASTKIINLTIE